MPVAWLLYVNVGQEHSTEAERIWKQECAPLMIKAPGCMSERLLKCIDVPGEYISYSEWENEGALQQYLKSDTHKEITRHTKGLQTKGEPVDKRYELTG